VGLQRKKHMGHHPAALMNKMFGPRQYFGTIWCEVSAEHVNVRPRPVPRASTRPASTSFSSAVRVDCSDFCVSLIKSVVVRRRSCLRRERMIRLSIGITVSVCSSCRRIISRKPVSASDLDSVSTTVDFVFFGNTSPSAMNRTLPCFHLHAQRRTCGRLSSQAPGQSLSACWTQGGSLSPVRPHHESPPCRRGLLW